MSEVIDDRHKIRSVLYHVMLDVRRLAEVLNKPEINGLKTDDLASKLNDFEECDFKSIRDQFHGDDELHVISEQHIIR